MARSRVKEKSQENSGLPQSTSPAVTIDADGNYRNTAGYLVPPEGPADFKIAEIEETLRHHPTYGDSIAQKVTLEVIGTKQPTGDYEGEPFRAFLFIPRPKSGKLVYRDRTTQEEKLTHAGFVLETMGLEVDKSMKFDDLIWVALLGGYLRGYVQHERKKGIASVKIKDQLENPKTGDIINRGLKPVTNEEYLKINEALQDGLND